MKAWIDLLDQKYADYEKSGLLFWILFGVVLFVVYAILRILFG